MAALRAAGVQVLHLTGAGKEFAADTGGAGAPYVVAPYADRMDLAYAAADLVVARAGANTVCELTAVGPAGGLRPAADRQRRAALQRGRRGRRRRRPARRRRRADARPGSTRPSCRSCPTATGSDAMAAASAATGERGADELLADLVAAAYAESARTGRPATMNGSNDRFDFTAPIPPLEELGSVHFIAIGGAGMSGVARVMLARGCSVSGSDAKQSPVLAALAAEGARGPRRPRRGIRRGQGHRRHLLGDPRVQHRAGRRARGAACGCCTAPRRWPARWPARGGSPSPGRTARPRPPRCSPSPCSTAASTRRSRPAASWPSTAPTPTGAPARSSSPRPTRATARSSSTAPRSAVVTNVQPDHLDFYGTFERVQRGLRRVRRDSIQPGGLLVACQDDEGPASSPSAARAPGTRVLTYGWSTEADVVLRGEVFRGLMGRVTVTGPDGVDAQPADQHPGPPQPAQRRGRLHRGRRRARARTRRGSSTGCSGSPAPGAGSSPRASAAGVSVVDDYAHNPGKVAAVVSTGAELVGDRPPRRRLPAAPLLAHPGLRPRVRRGPGCPPTWSSSWRSTPRARTRCPGVSSQLVADALRELRPDADVTVVSSWSAVAEHVAAAGPRGRPRPHRRRRGRDDDRARDPARPRSGVSHR